MSRFTDTPAVRKEVPLLIGIMSPSGGGKTYSALRLATGIQRVYGGDIFGLDSENDRMLHYADQFKFRHVPFKPPFGSLDYLEALRYCHGRGARITIVDSMSHEHIGEMGYLETAEAVVDRLAGDDYKKREAVKMLGWAKAGPLRQRMIEGIKQLGGVYIFCFRAKEKTKPVKGPNGKTEVIDMGLMPIAGEEWVYEMTVNCMLEPRSGGVPTWRTDHIGERLMMKLPEQFKGIFGEQAPLSEDIGQKLGAWAKGGSAKSEVAPTGEELMVLMEAGKTAAAKGKAERKRWWEGLTKLEQDTLRALQTPIQSTPSQSPAEAPRSDAGAAPSNPSAQEAAGAPATGAGGLALDYPLPPKSTAPAGEWMERMKGAKNQVEANAIYVAATDAVDAGLHFERLLVDLTALKPDFT